MTLDSVNWEDQVKSIMSNWEQDPEKSSPRVKPTDKNIVDSFSTHFLEHEFKKDDLLVHVFPRSGKEDRYYPSSLSKSGAYLPGRLEEPAKGVSFPDNIMERLELAIEAVWAGDVGVDYVPELKAYAIQFHGAANTLKKPGPSEFIDLFSEALDRNLEH